LVDPGKPAIHPDAETAAIPAHMVFLAHMGIIEIPDAIVLIEANQEAAVSHRNITWHGVLLIWPRDFGGGRQGPGPLPPLASLLSKPLKIER
jgi:hypothetical protein